ncbi:hypothetical protein DQM68_08340 [Leptospira mayottensis]|uniref:Uncharacterized protein n=1 Tax=Leptospira mayottensis TaxID=1137606 RepID=A0ABM6Y986_9LEPT|nr:hypothetical protein DQM68_08340 [Leptospira mayottensis]AXR64556.1 hypothetical protein DQM28_10300 [Leptospira mayottensis]
MGSSRFGNLLQKTKSLSQNLKIEEPRRELNNYKICSKSYKLSKGRNLWELLYYITNLLNDCN